jgi:signal transduction histidine kinase/DNA-binding response OmpR family regulator
VGATEIVLVVDDESALRIILSRLLSGMGCGVASAGSADEALPLLDGPAVSLALVDIVLPGMNGIELLGRIKQKCPDTEVIVMTSHASIKTVVEALRMGAYDYLHKPFELDEVTATVSRALERRRLSLHNRELAETKERQNQQLAVAVRRLASLNVAGIGLGALDSVPEILDTFIDLLVAELDVERASVMLTDATGDHLRIAAARGISEDIARTVVVSPGEGIAGQVFESAQPIFVADTRADPRTRGTARADLGSTFLSAPIFLSVPIKSRGRVLGVVNLTNRRSQVPFDQDDATFVSGLCGQVAVAIERARHSERLEETIRQLRATQDQLIASERVNALGEMAAGVAHDFNNILNGILGRAQLLLRAAEGATASFELKPHLQMIETLSLQGADTVRRIQDSASIRRSGATAALDLNAAVRLVVDLTRPKWQQEPEARGVHVEVSLDLETVPITVGNTLEIVQVLSNLLFNALEAMPTDGRITIRTRDDGEWIRLEVADTGVGMSHETREKLYQPFHTTKPYGHGMGLNVVSGIIQRMGGTIKVESEEGVGTTFTIRLPARAPALAASTGADPAVSGPGIAARVLVVDDEEYNRAYYQDCLALDGHRVTAAASGADALAALDHEAFDVLLTDVSMPGMSGWDLVAAVRDRGLAITVLLISGWGAQADDPRVRDLGVAEVLSKPLDVEDCRSAVQRALRHVVGGAASGRAPSRVR